MQPCPSVKATPLAWSCNPRWRSFSIGSRTRSALQQCSRWLLPIYSTATTTSLPTLQYQLQFISVSCVWCVRMLDFPLISSIASLHFGQIAQRYPLQQGHVLALLVSCFELQPDLEPLAILELRRHWLETMVFLMSCGCVQPVLTQVGQWAPTVDPHLTRSFIHSVLDIADPPYSAAFLTYFLPLFPRAITVEAMRAASDTRETVQAFISTIMVFLFFFLNFYIHSPAYSTLCNNKL